MHLTNSMKARLNLLQNNLICLMNGGETGINDKNYSFKREFLKSHPKKLTDQNYSPDNFCK